VVGIVVVRHGVGDRGVGVAVGDRGGLDGLVDGGGLDGLDDGGRRGGVLDDRGSSSDPEDRSGGGLVLDDRGGLDRLDNGGRGRLNPDDGGGGLDDLHLSGLGLLAVLKGGFVSSDGRGRVLGISGVLGLGTEFVGLDFGNETVDVSGVTDVAGTTVSQLDEVFALSVSVAVGSLGVSVSAFLRFGLVGELVGDGGVLLLLVECGSGRSGHNEGGEGDEGAHFD